MVCIILSILSFFIVFEGVPTICPCQTSFCIILKSFRDALIRREHYICIRVILLVLQLSCVIMVLILSLETSQQTAYPETIDTHTASKISEMRILQKFHIVFLVGAATSEVSVGVFKLVLLLAGCFTCLPCLAGLYLLSLGVPDHQEIEL